MRNVTGLTAKILSKANSIVCMSIVFLTQSYNVQNNHTNLCM